MIILAIGANSFGSFGSPMNTIRNVPALLQEQGVFPLAASHIYSTAPVGVLNQEVYLNAVLTVETSQSPLRLLNVLKMIERTAGRQKGMRWDSRPLDLDLVAYHNAVISTHSNGSVFQTQDDLTLILPHPLMCERPFVIRPLLDIAPHWRHPVTGETTGFMWMRQQHKQEGKILSSHGLLPINSRGRKNI